MFTKGSLRSISKSAASRLGSGSYFNFEQYSSGESYSQPYEDVTKEKENKGEEILLKEFEEYKKAEQFKKDLKAREEIEKKKREPQPMDLDSVPDNIILEPPKVEEEKKEFVPIQKQTELGVDRVYYTQIIKK